MQGSALRFPLNLRAVDTLDYIVIVDPTRVEAGFWCRTATRTWQSTTFRDLESVIEMPALGIAVTLASLYERVQVTPPPRLKPIWEDDTGASP